TRWPRDWSSDVCSSDLASESRRLLFGDPAPGFPSGISKEWSYNFAVNDVRDANGARLGAAHQPLAAFTAPPDTLLIVDGWPAARSEERRVGKQGRRRRS